MAVTVRQIVAKFPEFRNTPESVISLCLAEAVSCVNTTVWGPKADLGVQYLTAHLLHIRPSGEPARTARSVGRNGQPTDDPYKTRYDALKSQATFGFRVT